MMLTEVTQVASAALPIQALKDQLRLGSGFGADGFQDGLLESHLRAAMAAIEGRTAKAILARQYKLVLEDWRQADEHALPVAPISAVASVTVFDADGQATPLDAARWRLVADVARPKLVAHGTLFPAVPEDGRIEIIFDAGFGDWATVPADLAQAMLMLAAEYYEHRHETDRVAGLPHAVLALIERWRTVRVLGGGAR